MPSVSDDQIAQLNAIVQDIVTTKKAADDKTAASNAADNAAAKAVGDANQAKLDESEADKALATSVNALVTFSQTLAGTPPPTPPA